MVCAFALACTAGATPRKRALLVGINDYSASKWIGPHKPGTPDRDWPNLDGAINDVEAMREMLVARYGVEARDITVLEDQQATRAAILQALDTLERRSQKDDVAFFYYAGHGSQQTNRLSREPDRLDETLVPADSRAGAPDIRDKELRRIFNRILDRGARLTVLLDSCHSGSGARGLATGAVSRGVRRDPRDAADGAPEGPWPETRGALILSAAQDDELARETRDEQRRSYGIFSYAWLRAMRRASPNEPVRDTFLRAQAMVRADAPWQEPVLGGNDTATTTPFLGTRTRNAPMRIAVEEMRPDGTVILQGGWAHGLDIGSALRVTGKSATRLEIIRMLGLARAEARFLGARTTLASGTLLEPDGWAAPPARPLRVWIARTTTMPDVKPFVAAAARRGIRWIADPVESAPTHVLRWRNNGWDLIAGGRVERVTNLHKVPRGAALFVQLPAPQSLPQFDDGIEVVDRPELADYLLAGRFFNNRVEYAWIRPFTTTKVTRGALPARTAWSRDPLLLRDSVRALRRIRAWHLLESPSRAAYALTLRRARDRALVTTRTLQRERYELTLRARPDAVPSPRFFYAFLIDNHGKAILLYPLGGSVENRFPLHRSASAPSEIALDTSFDVSAPFGIDTYFLLSTDEPLPDPSILAWDGVRGRPPARTALEALLMQTARPSRSAKPVRTPVNWSIERVLYESR